MILLNKQIKNLFYTHRRNIAKSGYNILYVPNKTFFDLLLDQIPTDIMIPINLEQANGHESMLSNIFYSGLLINDIVGFSSNAQMYAEYYTKYIMLIHAAPSALFKKEDIYILANRLNEYEFLCFDQKPNSWPLRKINYTKYGVPKLEHLSINDKPKDILVINLNKQKQPNMLYQYLKNQFPKTDILESYTDFVSVSKIISQYKICIDLESYFNLIVANSCGCYGITAAETFDEHIYRTISYEDMVGIIPQLLSKNHNDSISIREKTLLKYDWNKFLTVMSNHIKKSIIEDLVV